MELARGRVRSAIAVLKDGIGKNPVSARTFHEVRDWFVLILCFDLFTLTYSCGSFSHLTTCLVFIFGFLFLCSVYLANFCQNEPCFDWLLIPDPVLFLLFMMHRYSDVWCFWSNTQLIELQSRWDDDEAVEVVKSYRTKAGVFVL